MQTSGFQKISGGHMVDSSGPQQHHSAKPSTQGGNNSGAMTGANRMNQTLYSNTMRQKNLSFNRSNIANNYLTKKGQAV